MNDPAMKKLIYQVENELYERELTMGDFSRQAFGHEARYYQVRRGVHSPAVRVLRQIADALCMDLEIKLIPKE